jgi:hypothetical protein
MLDNDQSLNWEEWLPVLMLSYNTQVYKATLEPPFFLTFLHMLFLDLQQPRPLYGENYASEAMGCLAIAYTYATEHLQHARHLREKYYDSKPKERSFAVGDRCLVHFEASAKGSNQKFVKRW